MYDIDEMKDYIVEATNPSEDKLATWDYELAESGPMVDWLYSHGFYFGQPGQYTEDGRYIRDWQVLAVVTGCDGVGNATLSLRNKFAAGDTLELVGPDCKPFAFTAPVMETLEGERLTEPKTPQMVFTMQLPRPVPPMSFIRHAVALSGK